MDTTAGLRTQVRIVVTVIAVLASACSAAPSDSISVNASASESASTPPSASASATASANANSVTEAEIDGLTGGVRVPIPAAAPSPMTTAVAAEAIVRVTYTGRRTTLGVIRVAMDMPNGAGLVTGWFVALTPAEDETCDFHAGLLPRAIEGGVVNDQDGDLFWIFVCG